MSRTPLTEKILVLGIDGFEPRLAKYLMDMGKMPNLKTFLERGSARRDLVLLGAHPVVTPPMWTTLSTGAYPETHGITAFHNPHPTKLGTRVYSLDSRLCQAESMWDVFAEAGKKTLVWHWPGSSWPPTSDSPNLAVVDGTQPASINMGVALVDWESVVLARESFEDLKFVAYDAVENTGAGCVITGLEDTVAKEGEASKGASKLKSIVGGGREVTTFTMDESDSEIELLGNINVNKINSPIKPATGWVSAPEGAKEFMVLTSNGFVRRPALIIPDEQGHFYKVEIYRSKKAQEPLVTLKLGILVTDIVDEIVVGEVKKTANRNMCLMELDENSGDLKLWMTYALDSENSNVWHPKSLYQDIVSQIGVVPSVTMASAKEPSCATNLMLPGWDHYCDWQADCLTYLMSKYDIIFSHLHNVDAIGHQMWHFAKYKEEWGNDAEFYQGLLDYTYKQTDDYIGRFLPYLDEGWTIILTSDHGLICEENTAPGLGEGGVNGTVMKELGYTVFKKDEQGHDLRELDFAKTRAIAFRGCHININLKSRYEYGVVEEEEQYALEEQIISDLYNYREPKTGRRLVAIALRRKDAAILGMNSEACGDIIYFIEEGFNIIHMDGLSTQTGFYHTSVSPIFLAAGPGIKAGFITDRVIRQVDVAPTIAVLGGVRMAAQNEGSVVHQILTEEF